VSGHVVGALITVTVQNLAPLWRQRIERIREVKRHVGRGVLVDRQRVRPARDEQVDDAGGGVAELGDAVVQGVRPDVDPRGLRLERHDAPRPRVRGVGGSGAPHRPGRIGRIQHRPNPRGGAGARSAAPRATEGRRARGAGDARAGGRNRRDAAHRARRDVKNQANAIRRDASVESWLCLPESRRARNRQRGGLPGSASEGRVLTTTPAVTRARRPPFAPGMSLARAPLGRAAR